MWCKLPRSNSLGYQYETRCWFLGRFFGSSTSSHCSHFRSAMWRSCFAGASKTAEKGWVWEEEARALRERWRSQGLRHHNALPWTEVPLGPSVASWAATDVSCCGGGGVRLLWASKKSGLSPVSARDWPFIVTNLFVDVSQNPSRNPWCYGLHRLTRTSQIYSYEYDRVISVFEAFRIYGWRSPRLEGLTTGEAWDLVGDSMALQTLAVSISGLVFGSGLYTPVLWEGTMG